MLILGVSKKAPQEGNVSPVPRFHFQYPPQLRQKAGAHKRAGLIYCLVTSHPPLGGWLVTKHPPSNARLGQFPTGNWGTLVSSGWTQTGAGLCAQGLETGYPTLELTSQGG